ncbi:excalibur calcium-binding domain-containing protein [Psychrobacter aquaticus]|uniref:Excalibur calcium-binding domain-containing protein n=1 Tax=Psychrobacter aquaticus CMS 56 TaxID=1354303 RepID=U4T5I5_9GAMM|nr:excalibur calcium-binding domain-containing protein [Psychrobacter aquaticus]ERL56160.1 hypothetical protein M917_0838 [Psychrobacter aquaticus CMS 56]
MKNIGLTLLPLILLALSTPALAKAKSCKDFKTQQEAQVYYETRKKAGQTGWKNLDRDKDGRACDCNKGGNGKSCPKN